MAPGWGPGVGTVRTVPPVTRRIRCVRCCPPPLCPLVPTAQMPPWKPATPNSKPGVCSTGLLTVVQLLPFQCTMTGLNGNGVLPTAHASLADTAVTAPRTTGAILLGWKQVPAAPDTVAADAPGNGAPADQVASMPAVKAASLTLVRRISIA